MSVWFDDCRGLGQTGHWASSILIKGGAKYQYSLFSWEIISPVNLWEGAYMPFQLNIVSAMHRYGDYCRSFQ